MEIVVLGFLLKKYMNKSDDKEIEYDIKEEEIINDFKNKDKQSKSTELSSMLSSGFFNLILIITAVVHSYNKYKDKDTPIKVGMILFALCFPIFYLLFTIILTGINKIK